MPALSPQRRHGNLLLDVPIAVRLTLGFLLAAVIAAAASGITGVQQTQSLSKEASFYQSLLISNTSLTTGGSYLQLMNSTTRDMLAEAQSVSPSRETLSGDQKSIENLADAYDAILTDYVRNYLLGTRPDRLQLLNEAAQGGLVTRQTTFVSSALRTWKVYRDAQTQVLKYIAAGDLTNADKLNRVQAESSNGDALSAIRALSQLNGRIAKAVRDAADIEQKNQLVISLVAAALAFLGVALVGWVISNTLIRRLVALRRITQLVEQGEVSARVQVVGRDEIGGVSASVNGMLDTIVGLLDVTRRQRDALTSAAERLFADVRVAGAGDLRVNAPVSGDPIGMLANAFNFTIGRFRRFVMRTQTSVDQLDIIGRQELDRAEAFLAAARNYVRGAQAPSQPSRVGQQNSFAGGWSGPEAFVEPSVAIAPQVEHARELLRQMAREGANHHARNVLDMAEQAYISAGRVSQLSMSLANQRSGGRDEIMRGQMDELRTLGGLLARLGSEAHAIQRNTGVGLAELDATLDQLSRTSQTLPLPRMGLSSSAPAMGSANLMDLVRLSSGFAQDVAALARQMMIINQEMRSGVAPFRLDANDASSNSTLYAPGTGYNEPARFEQFGQEYAGQQMPADFGASAYSLDGSTGGHQPYGQMPLRQSGPHGPSFPPTQGRMRSGNSLPNG